jgi:hypothetical protein
MEGITREDTLRISKHTHNEKKVGKIGDGKTK